MNIKANKLVAWLLMAVPFAVICVQFAADTITYGQVIHQTGLWSAGFLIAALAITPLRTRFGARRWFAVIVPYRRALGVASFAYAALHVGVYLERKWGADLILKEGMEAELATGWLAFAVFLVLALTSNDASVRTMGRAWKKLHRYVYAATALIFAHWFLATFDWTYAYVFGALLLATQLPRLFAGKRQSNG